MTLLELLFWFALLLLAFTYTGYPLLIAALAALRTDHSTNIPPAEPTVTLIVPARDEAMHIEEKIRDCARLDYPPEKLQLLIVDDGSRDHTAALAHSALAETHLAPVAGVLSLAVSHGKAAALNHAAQQATGDILAFTDADCRLEPQSLRILVGAFSDPTVGSVAARYAARETGRAASAYWHYEDCIRRKESRLAGLIGASGALYAVRRDLFDPLPQGLINDDFVVPMRILLKGYRTVYETRARAWENAHSQPRDEFRRRVRIMAGNCEHLLLFCKLLPEARHPMGVALQMFCHKFLRLLSPFLLLALLALSMPLAGKGISRDAGTERGGTRLPGKIYGVALIAQAVLYGAALTGVRGRPLRGAAIPHYFLMLNLAALVGVVAFALHGSDVAWGHQRPRERPDRRA